jgi:hypothetical protein
MSAGLKQVWGLKDAKGPPSTAQADKFKADYQTILSRINTALQYTVTNAEKPKHNEKAKKRDGLNTTYQSVLAKIDPRNPSKAESAIKSTLASANTTAKEIETFKADVEKAVTAWQAKDPQFEKMVGQVEELEAWGHNQAPGMRSLAAAIQQLLNDKKYVQALKDCDTFASKLKPIYEDYLKQKEAKEKYDAALPDLKTRLQAVSECRFKKLTPMQEDILAVQGKMEAAAQEKDYVNALMHQTDLSSKVDEYKKAYDELDAQKQKYDEALAKVQPRLDAITASEAGKPGGIQQEMMQLETDMKAAADAEDFEKATTLGGELDAKLTEFEEILKKRDEYRARLEKLQPDLAKASQSDPRYADLQPIQADMATTQTEMESAASAEDYENALQLLDGLEGKVHEYFDAIEKKKQEYEAARAAAQEKFEDCFAQARLYPPLETDRQALKAAQKEMGAAGDDEDYDKGKKLATELGTKADAYLAKCKTEQEKYDKKGEEIKKALDDASYFGRDDVARDYANSLSKDEIKFLPQEVRNRLMEELQGGVFSDDDKKAIQKLYAVRTLDPEFEKAERKHRDKLIEFMRNDPELAKARDDWPKLSPEDRVKMMEKVAKYHCEAYGTDPSTMKVEAYNKDPEKDKDGNVVSWNNGVYNHSSGTITINTNPYWDATKKQGVKSNDFDLAMDLITHESGHRYQSVLAERVKSGKIKPGDPEYQQAVAFKLNDDYYVQPEDGYTVYENQPMEAHSRISGHAVDEAGIGKSKPPRAIRTGGSTP